MHHQNNNPKMEFEYKRLRDLGIVAGFAIYSMLAPSSVIAEKKESIGNDGILTQEYTENKKQEDKKDNVKITVIKEEKKERQEEKKTEETKVKKKGKFLKNTWRVIRSPYDFAKNLKQTEVGNKSVGLGLGYGLKEESAETSKYNIKNNGSLESAALSIDSINLGSKIYADIAAKVALRAGDTEYKGNNVGDVKDAQINAGGLIGLVLNNKKTKTEIGINAKIDALNFNRKENYAGIAAETNINGIGAGFGASMEQYLAKNLSLCLAYGQSSMSTNGEVSRLLESVCDLECRYKKARAGCEMKTMTTGNKEVEKQLAAQIGEYGRAITANAGYKNIDVSWTSYDSGVTGDKQSISYKGKKFGVELYSQDTKYSNSANTKVMPVKQSGINVKIPFSAKR